MSCSGGDRTQYDRSTRRQRSIKHGSQEQVDQWRRAVRSLRAFCSSHQTNRMPGGAGLICGSQGLDWRSKSRKQTTEKLKLWSCLTQMRTDVEVTLLNSRNSFANISLFELHMSSWVHSQNMQIVDTQDKRWKLLELVHWSGLLSLLCSYAGVIESRHLAFQTSLVTQHM